MTISHSAYRVCMRPTCGFRFPQIGVVQFDCCPKCGAPTRLLTTPKSLPALNPAPTPPGPEVEVLLDNIRSAFNVGAMFRTADGAAVRHMHLCGVTPTPGHPKVVKTALGAESTIAWTQHWNGLEAARHLKTQGLRLWALESCTGSESIFTAAQSPTAPPFCW